MVLASEEVTPMTPQVEQNENAVNPSTPTPGELSLVGLDSPVSGGEDSLVGAEASKGLDDTYMDGIRNHNPVDVAKSQYWQQRFEYEQTHPEAVKARQDAFFGELIAQGMSPEQAMTTMGVGEDADMEPAYLADPVNWITDLASGGLQGAIKAGASKVVGEVAGKGALNAIGKGLVSGAWKAAMPVVPIIKGWQAVGGKELGKMAAREAIKDFGMGLASSGSMDLADSAFHNSFTTVLSGIAGPMFGPYVLRTALKHGPEGISILVRSLKEKNPEVATQLRDAAEGMAEEFGWLKPRMGESAVTPEAKAMSDSEVSLDLAGSLVRMKQAQDEALSRAAAANRGDVGEKVGQSAESLAAHVASKMRMDADFALKKAGEAATDAQVKALEEEAAMKQFLAAIFEEVPAAKEVSDKIARDAQDALLTAEGANARALLDTPTHARPSYSEDVVNRHYPQWEGDKQLPEVDPLAPGKGEPERIPLDKTTEPGKVPGELPEGKYFSPSDTDWAAVTKDTLEKARAIRELPKKGFKEPPSLKSFKFPVRGVEAPSVVSPGETKPAKEVPAVSPLAPKSSLPPEEVKKFQEAVLSGDNTAVQDLLDINYNNIHGGEDIKQLVATAFDTMPSLRRGTKTWEEARQLAADYDLKEVVKFVDNSKDLDSKLYGYVKAWDAHMANVKDIATKYQAALAAGNVPPDLEVQAVKAIKLAAVFMDGFMETRSNAGRMLNMFKTLGEYKGDMEGILLMSRAVKNEMGGELLDTITRVTAGLAKTGSKKELKNVMKAAGMSRTTGMFIETMMGSYLSSIKTLFVNTAGPALALTQSVGERLLAVANRAGRGGSFYEFQQYLKGGIEAILPMREVDKEALRLRGEDVSPQPWDNILKRYGLVKEEDKKAFIVGSFNTIRDVMKVFSSPAIKIANEGVRRRTSIVGGRLQYTSMGRSFYAEAAEDLTNSGHKFTGGAVGLMGQALNAVGRGMTWTDGVFKTMAYSAEVRSQAARKALSEGLTGEALGKRVDEIISEMPEEIHNKAIAHAREIAMQADPQSAFMKHASAAMAANPALRVWFWPFVRTGMNVMRWTAERVPGLNLLTKSSREALMSGDPAERSLALAKLELGSMIMATGFGLLSSGHYTGAAPQDPKARQLWLQAGNLPHHLKFGDKYFDLRRLEPFSTHIMMMGEFVETLNTLRDEDVESHSGVILGALYNFLEDRTFLQGTANLLDAVSDASGHGMEKLMNNIVSSSVPLSSFNRSVNRSYDPYIREAWNAWEAVKTAIPGTSHTIPPRRTILGEPVKHSLANIDGPSMDRFFSFEGAFNSMINPLTVGEKSETPNAYDEMARLAEKGLFHHRPVKDKLYVPETGEVVPLSHEEYSELMDIMSDTPVFRGKNAREAVESFINSPFYKDTLKNDIQKGEELSKFMALLRSSAVDKFLRKRPELRQMAVEQARMRLKEKMTPQ